MRTRYFLWLFLPVAFYLPAVLVAGEHFSVAAGLELNKQGETQLVVQVAVPPGSKLYADQFQVEVPKPLGIIPLSLPVPQNEKDVFSGEQKLVYSQSFTALYLIENSTNEVVNVKVRYQGCDQKTCFLPAEEEFQLKWKAAPVARHDLPCEVIQTKKGVARLPHAVRHYNKSIPSVSAPLRLAENVRADWLKDISRNYKIASLQSGYMDARSFLSLLRQNAPRLAAGMNGEETLRSLGEGGLPWLRRVPPSTNRMPHGLPGGGFTFLDLSGKGGAELSPIQKTWQVGKLWVSILLMILGGLALNLTPCVLPLIPVNLAIIGAGVRAASVRRGFLLGMVYGLGIVLAYGALGLVTVLTGAQFGALNASPWFNLVVALVFLLLGLALLDVFMIDFSRFQGRFQLKGQGMFFILILGAVSALLAGACVAPVVIAVLLLAADLYLKGQVIGLLLPFFLGLGMALPWPFAGAGLSFLPKPGKWMVHIKHIFVVVILLAAFYYFFLGSKLLYARYSIPTDSPSGQADDGWLAFPDALTANKEKKPRTTRGKPVLVYFGATWCKSCQVMNGTTFKNPAVRKKMDDFICVKYQAENPRDDSTKSVLREFGVMGLPTFVILTPTK